MATFDIAFDWLMDSEDVLRKCEVVPDCGGHAISGINSRSFPVDFETIKACDPLHRLNAVKGFYYRVFWHTPPNHWFDQLKSDELAKRVFDASVNMGAGTATKLLQEAINECGQEVVVDGRFGVGTLSAANAADEKCLIAAFKGCRVQHYKDIAENDPTKEAYLAVWLYRAEK